jgi:cell division septation protein DedD
MLGVGLLGVGAALLVACGDTKGLIPAGDADALKQDLDQVAAAVADGKCSQAQQALQRAHADFDALPADVDPGVKSKLAAGLANLADQVPGECAENAAKQNTTTETTPTDTTPTDTTPTETTPTETTPTETTPTETTPTETTPTETTPAPPSGGQTAPTTP